MSTNLHFLKSTLFFAILIFFILGGGLHFAEVIQPARALLLLTTFLCVISGIWVWLGMPKGKFTPISLTLLMAYIAVQSFALAFRSEATQLGLYTLGSFFLPLLITIIIIIVEYRSSNP